MRLQPPETPPMQSTHNASTIPHHVARKQLAPSRTTASSRASSTHTPPPAPTKAPLSQSQSQLDSALHSVLELQNTGVNLHSKRPFAALLLAPDNATVLLTHLSISHVQHAEAELARLASIHYSQSYLWDCTLVSTWEPCAMCTGTLYWANIGRLVYAASEEELNKMTGSGNGENMTMALPCRDVLRRGQKEVEVVGPVKGWEERVVCESRKYWRPEEVVHKEGDRSVSSAAPTTWEPDLEYDTDLQSAIDWLR